MKFIKKLDLYVLKNFMTLFAGTFCICLFVVMMQFLWRFVDELVGKGLDVGIIAELFFYAGLTLVPLALPLAILLASLISFGNMGERLELLSIKAAGISLIRTLAPLIVVVTILAGVSFYFQDVVAPHAQLRVYQIRYSIMQKSPELDIPEGVFYDGIDQVNLYVKQKNKKTGMLYDVVIYNMMDGVNNAHIILADSASLETSEDKRNLLLHLYQGEQFENMPNSSIMPAGNVMYRRETFVEKHFVINFDTNFKMADSEAVSSSANTKDINTILATIDSLKLDADSCGHRYYNQMKGETLYVPQRNNEQANESEPTNLGVAGSMSAVGTPTELAAVPLKKTDAAKKSDAGQKASTADKANTATDELPNIDTLFASKSVSEQAIIVNNALQRVRIQQMNSQALADTMSAEQRAIRMHWIQFWTEITMALACIVFFFIGAPLGAIIRKGGLGLPVVVSVIIFIIYYVINTGGMKMSREGEIPVWIGMWASTIVLAPLGAFFTIKSNNDSVVFNMDTYRTFFIKLLGIPQHRHITKKEVIIQDPDYATLLPRIRALSDSVKTYRKNNRRLMPLQLMVFVLKNQTDEELQRINTELEAVVDELSNSRDRQILIQLNEFPILRTAPRLHNRLRKELRTVQKTCDKIIERINEMQ